MESGEPRTEASRLLAGLTAGDPSASTGLLPLIYDELRALAASYLRREKHGHSLQATALVHEAWIRLIGHQHLHQANRAQFFAVAAQAIRHVLVDHARARGTRKRGGGLERISLSEDVALVAAPEVDLLSLDEALGKLARLDPRQAKVVEMRFFGGLSVEEVAGLLGVSPRTVEEDWHMARAFLRRELEENVT